LEKILIIEDEKKIARFLELELMHEGYEVICAFDGRSGLDMIIEENPNLIILDLMLPYLSGVEICRRLRAKEDYTPIIMLTAKSDVSDKVMGLDVGADDYMTKPFAVEELLARIRNILIRRENILKPQKKKIKIGSLLIDKERYEVYFEDEKINLTKKEFELLEYLASNKNTVLTREKIVEDVWGYSYENETNVVDVYIRYLRSKVDQKYNKNYIRTVRGVGYELTDEE